MGMKRWITCSLLLCALAAFCNAPLAARKETDISMRVTGTIEVDTAGVVSEYSIDREEALPDAVVELLHKAVPGWRFEPVQVDGKPARAVTDMSLRVVATPEEGGLYRLSVRGASFGTGDATEADEDVKPQDLTPPDYPRKAILAGAEATVYLVLKVGRDGSVEDVVAEQVNVRADGSEKTVERFRRIFTEASVAKARTWKYRPPLRGEHVDAPFWSVRVPVVFGEPIYGRWEAYRPGPRVPIPWRVREEAAAFTPDSLPDGGSFSAGRGLRPLNDLNSDG